MRLLCRKAKEFEGRIRVPGDKSISHRAAMLASIGEGESVIESFNTCKDCQSTLKCLKSLGVEWERREEKVWINGRGLWGLREAENILNAGNSGTTIRLLSGILAGQIFLSVITGDASLRRRPMDRIKIPLELMGAKIMARASRYPPLAIWGGKLKGIEYRLPVASAQVKSCLLLAGLYAEGETRIYEPAPSRDHTERMLSYMGVNLERDGGISIKGGVSLNPLKLSIPGDFSSAAFFLALALLTNSRLVIQDVGLNPTRTGMLNVLKNMGAKVEIKNVREVGNEPIGDLEVIGGELEGTLIEKDIPLMIDEIPILAILGARAKGITEIRNAKELRHKEADRIRALAIGLRRMGIDVEEREDGMLIKGGEPKGAIVNSYGDHRIAMAFTILGLASEGETLIRGVECIDISFPGFVSILKSLVGSAIEIA
ncbi:3-phosphoshikimate 1-carboxyvinyltransferase [bacterium]|nr:3-phosphoshikimate 1-carboxyvinyltransferase [bacterium]